MIAKRASLLSPDKQPSQRCGSPLPWLTGIAQSHSEERAKQPETGKSKCTGRILMSACVISDWLQVVHKKGIRRKGKMRVSISVIICFWKKNAFYIPFHSLKMNFQKVSSSLVLAQVSESWKFPHHFLNKIRINQIRSRFVWIDEFRRYDNYLTMNVRENQMPLETDLSICLWRIDGIVKGCLHPLAGVSFHQSNQ